MMKRTFDLVTAVLGLILVSPVLLMTAGLIKCTSRGPVFFQQERIGRNFRPFRIFKFRTMVQDAPKLGGQITCGDDSRITLIGRLLRKTKLDELPQLFNVLKGDMSLVGPRPEVPRYVEMFREDYAEILRVRPGITDLASLYYRDEASLLGHADDPEEEYIRCILPEKMRLAKEYIAKASLVFDLMIILKTVLCIMSDRVKSPEKDCDNHVR